jgi:hypothetical protein
MNLKTEELSMLKEKMELTALGYLFALANIYLTLSDKPLPGIAFGFVACYFFIKALLVRNK